MDGWRKKFKPTRPPNIENSTDILDEVESKWADMQPKIQESTGDKLKLQRQVLELRNYIEYCQIAGEKVSEDQQERIKEIIRKCKDVLAKYGNTSDVNTSGLKSPRLFRKNMSAESNSEQIAPQNKVALVEVEEKLKSMRQRRLDRLSVFVAEQSKLSEERSNKNRGSYEIENAIKSIQQIGGEKKGSFKSITEESSIGTDDTIVRRHSSESMEKPKPSSTKKFINKFNCSTTQAMGSSNEDLTEGYDGKKVSDFTYSKPIETKPVVASKVEDEKHLQDLNMNRNSFQAAKEALQNKNSSTEQEHKSSNRSSLQNSKEQLKESKSVRLEKESDNYNPLLSPVGKQRKAIYLYDNECKFLENEKLSSVVSLQPFEKSDNRVQLLNNADVKLKVNIPQVYENRDIIAKNEIEKSQRVLTTFGKTNQEHISKKLDIEPRSKIGHVYENRIIIDKNEIEKSQKVLTTFGKNNYQNDAVRSEDKIVPVRENKQIFVENDTDKILSGSSTYGRNQEKSEAYSKETVSKEYETKTVSANNKSDKYVDPGVHKFDNKNTETSVSENVKFKPRKSNSFTKPIIKTEVTAHRKSADNVLISKPLRSPLPLPKKSSHGERVLKKLQRNWDSLNEIIDNDSDVDCDEIEDLKKTWEEANTLLCQYKARIEKLEKRPKDDENNEKLNETKKQLTDVAEALNKFSGLKRDSSYKQLSSRLSNYFLVINKLNSSKAEVLNEKRLVLSEIETHVKMLENKVNRNEDLLLEILEAQVTAIGTRYLNITSV